MFSAWRCKTIGTFCFQQTIELLGLSLCCSYVESSHHSYHIHSALKGCHDFVSKDTALNKKNDLLCGDQGRMSNFVYAVLYLGMSIIYNVFLNLYVLGNSK